MGWRGGSGWGVGFVCSKCFWTDSSVFSPHLGLAGVPWAQASLTLGSLLWSKTRNWASQMEVGWGIPFWKAAWLKTLNLQRERSTLLVDRRAPVRGSWPHRSEDLREIGSRLETPGLILWWAFFPQSGCPCSDSVSPRPPVKGSPPRLPSHAGGQY